MSSKAILARIGQAALVIWATFTLAFILLSTLPSDAVAARYDNPNLGLTPEQLADIHEVYGADEPVVSRYFSALTGFLSGDFGYSVASGTAVSEMLANAIPSTLALAALAFLVGAILAFAVAVLSTFGPMTWLRSVSRSLPSVMVSVPTFWIGIILIQVFSFGLGWVPVIGANPAQSLVLPVITLAIAISAPLAQVLMRSIDEVMDMPFVKVVRAKGASGAWLLWRNVLRNAFLPVLTMAGLTFGELIGGSVVTEAVFARHGIGALTVDAVADRDTSVLLAIVVLAATVFVLINLVVDLLYPVLDVRLRQRRTTTGSATSSATAREASESHEREEQTCN
ncbi:ABC transporter permease [Corynebacterium propinquum]|uniref:ABC transporter permease n=1 Tax=Corynebacterium propinquum TaxID=43769 RepID=UPI002540A052|nr:ABC transporter permease [Corynebacterium propinquum]MDK4235239.1 ABC transporter permease [Corynebacterium propinquum]